MNAEDQTSPPPPPRSPRVSTAAEGSISLVDQRFAGLDVLRFVSAVLIVYLHTTGATSLQYTNRSTRIAVPFFTAAGVMLAFLSGRKPGRSLARYSRLRVARVYLPFLVWVLIYYVVGIAGGWVKGRGQLDAGGWELNWRWLTDGNVHHLWFLPFICVVGIVVFAAARLLTPRPRAARGVAVGLLVLGGWTAVMPAPMWARAAGDVVGLGYNTASAWFWVLAVLLWMDTAGRLALPRVCTGWVAWLLLAVCVVLQAIYGRIIGLENIAGVALLAVGLGRLPGQDWAGWATLGGWAYGIYLVHIVFVETLQDVVTMLGYTETGFVTVAIFIASLAGSMAVCAVLGRWSFSRHLGVARLGKVPAAKPQ